MNDNIPSTYLLKGDLVRFLFINTMVSLVKMQMRQTICYRFYLIEIVFNVIYC